MADKIVVFGVEGSLGYSVAKRLSKHYHVKAIPTTPKVAENLTETDNLTVYDAEKFKADKMHEILDGVSGVFVATNTDFNAPDGYNEEVRQGELIAEACSKAGVKHVVLHTALGVEQILGLGSRHMDAKCAIGEIMKRLNVPLTTITTPCFYEELLHPLLKPRKLPNGSFGFEIAAGNCALDWMSIDDVGDVIASVFKNKDEYLNKTLSLSANKLSLSEITAILTKHLPPASFVDKMITVHEMRQQGYPGASDLANMFDFYCRVDQRKNVNLTRKLNPSLRTLDEWIQDNLATIKYTFNSHA